MSNFSIYILIFCVYVVLILFNYRFDSIERKIDMLFDYYFMESFMGDEDDSSESN